MVLDIANPFFTDLARGVEEVANAQGLSVILCNSDGRPAKEAAHLEVLTEQRVRGVVLTPTAELSPQIETLRQRGVPVVLLDRRAPGPDQCAVAVDDVLGGLDLLGEAPQLFHLIGIVMILPGIWLATVWRPAKGVGHRVVVNELPPSSS